MNGTAKVNLRLADAAKRMEATQKLHPKKWQRHGSKFIESINKGQGPRVLAVGPRVVGGLKACYRNKPGYGGIPGNVFEVTTMNNGNLDGVGGSSVFYAVEHLGIKVVDVWGNGSKTQGETIKSLKKFVPGPVEIREISISGDEPTNVREAEAVVVSCSDSRVQAHDIYDDVVVVSNAGNVLSPAAIEVIGEMVEKGVPIAMVMGHTKCGAVGAAVAGNIEAGLAEVMSVVGMNIREAPEDNAGAENVYASAEILKGNAFAGYYGESLQRLQGRIRDAKTEIIASFLDLSDGKVREL
ncbi:hypothetical protein GF412_03315 [Candidatus Micrarchaeota archaeon]|nr:hypothetical protein [Candidatus Micrarchaeota archaeon]MBD3417981.1 hypothetical protein [Candidatus Micrarchaeota archaeon]